MTVSGITPIKLLNKIVICKRAALPLQSLCDLLHTTLMNRLLFAAFCTACLPYSLQQVVPASLPLSGLCHVSQQDLRVLPASGFSRSVLAPYTNTTTTGVPPVPIPSVANLSGCLFQSYDPRFDRIIGNNQTVYQVGPTRSVPWAVESPAYLPGSLVSSFCASMLILSHKHGYSAAVNCQSDPCR